MAEASASPTLVKFVRRALRREPNVSFEQLLERWRLEHPDQQDEPLLRQVYDGEVIGRTENATGGPHGPNYNRNVLLIVVAWVAANAALALLIGLPAYLQCRQRAPGGTFGACGLNLGVVFLAVGAVQVVYGLITAVVAGRFSKSGAQGVLIGTAAVFLLFGALCFGVTASR
jgi:hypothetical protein